MGRVFGARDTQLGRTVAVKLLPLAFAADQDMVRRFEQEARATAALNHPGIMAVYDAGVHEGTPYLVSELLEGTTLRTRLEAGRLPLVTALDFAVQIADALAAAHAHGVIHRDLKPENLFVCAGDRIKILDFGLAKLTQSEGVDRTRIGGVTTTLPKTVLGTPAYMPPEQARGEKADSRADIFSFGCILYEMLSGDRAFEGGTPADVISAILKDPPKTLDNTAERPLPPMLDAIVRRCLEKEPGARFQSASDLAFALRNISTLRGKHTEVAAPRRPRAWSSALTWALAIPAAVVTIALIGMVKYGGGPAVKPPVTEFVVPPPTEDHGFAPLPLPGLLPTAPLVGLSPDGRSLAFVAEESTTGKRKLWIRSLDSSRPRAIEGTDDAASWPFWSPDNRYVVVSVGKALIKVDTLQQAVERFCTLPAEAPALPFVTGAWSADVILFSIGGKTGLYAVGVSGGTPRPVTTIDAKRGDQYHSWPQLLPERRFLFFVRTDNAETNGMYAGRLDSPDVTRVQANGSRAVYAAGHLLWAIEDRLVAQPFDAATLRLSGQPATVVPSVFQGAGRTPGFWASNTETLVYATGDTRERQFRWFTRSGAPLETVGPPGLYVTFDVSPDLSKVVAEVSKDISARYSTLALFEKSRGVLTPLTVGDQNDSDPRFGPGGDVVFARNSRDGAGIMRINPSTGRPSVLLSRGTLPVMWLEDWANDGSSIVYRSAANRDAWQLYQGRSEPERLSDAREPIEQVQLSPDRRWVAYNTAETGRSEVYVSSVPFGGERLQVSATGGVQATWREDGRELYYLGLDGGLYAVEITTGGPTIHARATTLLFRTSLPVISAVVEQYRPGSDGQRFLFCLPLTSVRREPLRMLVNWPGRLTGPDVR